MADGSKFKINLSEKRLWRDGDPVSVKKKVFDLLRFFVTHEDALVSKKAILAGVWPNTHVSDASVKDGVRNLRELLRDDPGNPGLIETVRGRGYRYLGGIEIQDPASLEQYHLHAVTPFHERPAIAVLPFENLSMDHQQQYFSDGLSEDIITLLSAWRLFPVIARSSSFVFRNTVEDIRQVAKDLAARYVIEGGIKKSNGNVRVSTQLVDGETGHILWAAKYENPLKQIFEVQDEITRGIVSSVEPQIEAAERNRTKLLRSANISAWEYFLRGRGLMNLITPSATDEARILIEKAIEIDPEYADAYAALSHIYQRQFYFEIAEDRAACGEKALETALKAVALDDDSSFAHMALGSAYIWTNQHDLSIAETRMAVELNPSNIQAVLALGNRLDIIGKPEEGVPLLEKALDLHPMDPYSRIYFAQLARAYINRQDYERALTCLLESVRRAPDFPQTYHVLAICLGHLGRLDEARQAARRCEEIHPGFIEKRAYWNIYLDAKANDNLTEGLRKAGLVV